MIEGFDVVLFTYADWHAVKSTPQHIAKLLARGNRVLFVDMPRSFFRFLKTPDPLSSEAWQGERLQEILPNLFLYHPLHCFLPVGGLPFPVASRSLAANGLLLANLVKAQMKRLGMRDVLFWNFSPIHGGAAPFIERRLSVHDICDEWANYLPGASDRKLVEWMDRRLTAAADVVFVFSRHMKAQRDGLCPETHVVLPAGDVEHYSKACNPETVVPEDLARMPKPIVGAICVVDSARFDPALLARMAQLRPDWTIAVLGPVREGVDLSVLRPYPNVRMMDNRPLEQMPAYLKGFDVAIVPYALNDATRGIYPMKLQEYLAAGKPVVSPRLPECAALRDVVYFSGSHDDFVANVERALQEDSPQNAAARREVARQNSWDHRIEERSTHIMRLLERTSR